jgi:hypothetical protein
VNAFQAEQMEIYEANGRGKKPLTWAQTRNMPLTYRVINTFCIQDILIAEVCLIKKEIMSNYMESTGYIRELEDGEHHIFHIQGSSG